MRAVLQRVSRASVIVAGEIHDSIGFGYVVLLAIGIGDSPEDEAYIVDKTINMRIFPNSEGRFDRSISDMSGELLLISQFTLYGDTRKGRRPSFTGAAPPEIAAEQFASVVERFRATGLSVKTGRFQAMMDVELVNDGPVTIVIDSTDRYRSRK